MSASVAKIEARLGERLGRDVVWAPSGRVALYLALRQFVPPGSSLLLSPVVCDAVLTVVLAAGLRPLFGPVDSETGNLAPESIPEEARRRAGAVLATNLYGVPDPVEELASRFPVVIEDACQAFDSRIGGRRVGTFGPVSVFSFAKHLGLRTGGAIAVLDAALREPLEEARNALLLAPPMRSRLRRVAASVGLPPSLKRVGTALLSARRAPAREGHRVVYDPTHLVEASERAPSLPAFDRWLRPDHPRYRERPSADEAEAVLAALDRLPAESRARIDGAGRLAGLGLTPRAVAAAGETSALFRVPLLARDREPLRAALVGRGLTVNCIYDPPLDACLEPSRFDRCGPGPDGALLWSRHVLPVDPLQADRVIEALRPLP